MCTARQSVNLLSFEYQIGAPASPQTSSCSTKWRYNRHTAGSKAFGANTPGPANSWDTRAVWLDTWGTSRRHILAFPFPSSPRRQRKYQCTLESDPRRSRSRNLREE